MQSLADDIQVVITDSILDKVIAESERLTSNNTTLAYLEARSEQISGMIELAQLVSMPASLLEELEVHKAALDTAASDARPWNRRAS